MSIHQPRALTHIHITFTHPKTQHQLPKQVRSHLEGVGVPAEGIVERGRGQKRGRSVTRRGGELASQRSACFFDGCSILFFKHTHSCKPHSTSPSLRQSTNRGGRRRGDGDRRRHGQPGRQAGPLPHAGRLGLPLRLARPEQDAAGTSRWWMWKRERETAGDPHSTLVGVHAIRGSTFFLPNPT